MILLDQLSQSKLFNKKESNFSHIFSFIWIYNYKNVNARTTEVATILNDTLQFTLIYVFWCKGFPPFTRFLVIFKWSDSLSPGFASLTTISILSGTGTGTGGGHENTQFVTCVSCQMIQGYFSHCLFCNYLF